MGIIIPVYKKGEKKECITFPTNYVHYFIQHPVVNVNSICKGNYRGSSMRISTQQDNY